MNIFDDKELLLEKYRIKLKTCRALMTLFPAIIFFIPRIPVCYVTEGISVRLIAWMLIVLFSLLMHTSVESPLRSFMVYLGVLLFFTVQHLYLMNDLTGTYGFANISAGEKAATAALLLMAGYVCFAIRIAQKYQALKAEVKEQNFYAQYDNAESD